MDPTTLSFLLVILSGVGVWVDARRLGYRQADVPGGTFSPLAWGLFVVALWIYFFPAYLFKRGVLKASGERRREALRALVHMGLLRNDGSPPATGPISDLIETRAADLVTEAEFEVRAAALAGSKLAPTPRQKMPNAQKAGAARRAEVATAAPNDPSRALSSLADMRTKGLVSDAEYEAKKTEILARL